MTNPTETWEERQARETSEAHAKTRELFKYAAGIVHELGSDSWELVPTTDDRTDYVSRVPHIRRKTDGANFDISTAYRDKDRVSVSANWPKDATGQENRPYFSQYSESGATSPSITFARSKSPMSAARDIARRFLPAFLKLWEQQAEQVTRMNDNRGKRLELARAIAWLLGGKVTGPRDQYDQTPPNVSLGYRPHGIGSVKFDHDDRSIAVELHCTLDELKQLAALFPVKSDDSE